MSDSARPHKTNLADAFAGISEFWSPRVAGDINDFQVKLAKFQGVFDWHQHEQEDELFLVVKGRLRMGLRTGDIDLDAGEMIIVPRGTEHRPEALTEECHVLMLEPASTVNTGNKITAHTVTELDRI